jgi:predicted DCC family thiol-disulfide oxidoreductase YuxK
MSERSKPKPVIVFDGECVLCSASAQFIMRHDHQRLFRLTTSQSDAGRRLYHRFGLDPDALTTMILVDGERVFAQSDAVLGDRRQTGMALAICDHRTRGPALASRSGLPLCSAESVPLVRQTRRLLAPRP